MYAYQKRERVSDLFRDGGEGGEKRRERRGGGKLRKGAHLRL